MAARSVAKVSMLRHAIQGVPLPADFLDRHPEARAVRVARGGGNPSDDTTAPPCDCPTADPALADPVADRDGPAREDDRRLSDQGDHP